MVKALSIDQVGSACVVDTPRQPLGPGDVRVGMKYVGLCGSDLNTYRGRNPLVNLPRIPGHEVAGVILEAGADCPSSLSVGQSVTLWPYSHCGDCTSCRRGRFNACRNNQTLGVQRDGALREEMVMPAVAVIPVSTLPLRHIALIEPLSVGHHAVHRAGVEPGDTVLVLGCGMIGLGAVLAAARLGAKVIAVDPLAFKQAVALQCGAAVFLTESGEALAERIGQLTGGNGCDVVIEAVGLPQTFVAAVDLAAFTGRVAFVGYAKEAVSFQTKFFNLKELDMFGSRNATRADFDAVISVLETTGDAADALITREYALGDAPSAFAFWDQNPGSVLKLMVAL